ncbi:chemotaxis-specific protein-glutamate methyltransferase CheB [Legionella jamestowniensis]|uniref:Protein-glutamate methylesterase/protein-glutamine glutaminase n=1 Tax=Legionella jamestowniensis TaxID=455 RepID=A0A0W0UP51_9GAMM|nr:chemotaxis-specific protein-glutamate methyltransferase CheB [Legionella jamestowniensis]KTD09421.1 chemotaxis response regulator protein-glutamate methylesterase CheB [Legionella jamestowniensis]OCH99247.1 hypothetical protein A8135_08360 [Legionella jamestowniensis]SFL88993.1 two-component system, chemotaxis family, response regulator CheB [Legionella jamestowniensis DSM 19215]
MKKTIKVLIVDDSKVTTQLLRTVLEEEPNIEVVGCAGDGVEAVRLTKQLRPDLVTMDIFMPNMDGVEATRKIMQHCPTPIIILSSYVSDNESKIVFNALQAGALSIIEKPKRIQGEGFSKIRRQLINSIKTLANVHVVPRKLRQELKPTVIQVTKTAAIYNILALGTSTGGPTALGSILSALPENFPLPVVVVQHIADGFLSGLVSWLQQKSKLVMEIAQDNQTLLPGHVYFAGDGAHLVITKGDRTPVATLEGSAPIDYFKPSITVLFSSLAKNYPGTAIGGLLTGMGRDGAEGLLLMKQANCLTFTQSEATSVVYGMPAAAVSLNATEQILDLEKIPQFLATIISKGEYSYDAKNLDC